MSRIYNMISDAELREEFLRNIRNRKLGQKFLYFDDGSKSYYSQEQGKSLHNNNRDNYSVSSLSKIRGLTGVSNQDIAFISLGSGNSEKEKRLFSEIDTSEISYFGVDISKDMLELGYKNMKEISNLKQKKFICADFSTNEFKSELTKLTSVCENRIFVFFSNTFGNIAQTSIIDILYNLMKKDEMIWLDVRLRNGTKAKDDMLIMSEYRKIISSFRDSFFLSPLEKIGINKDDGELLITSSNEENIKSLNIKIMFKVNKKLNLHIRSESVTILPGEKLSLVNMRLYDVDGLIHFFEEYGFEAVYNEQANGRGHFLFRRK